MFGKKLRECLNAQAVLKHRLIKRGFIVEGDIEKIKPTLSITDPWDGMTLKVVILSAEMVLDH